MTSMWEKVLKEDRKAVLCKKQGRKGIYWFTERENFHQVGWLLYKLRNKESSVEEKRMGSGDFFPAPPPLPDTHYANYYKANFGKFCLPISVPTLISELVIITSFCHLSFRYKLQHRREASTSTYKIQGENGKQVRLCAYGSLW